MLKRYAGYDPALRKFYRSAAWRHKREEILRRDHYECVDCRRRLLLAGTTGAQLTGWEKHIQPAECVHHIKELKDFPELALDDDNLISLCHRCHDIRHDRYGAHGEQKRREPITKEQW